MSYLPVTHYAMSVEPDYAATAPLREAIDGQLSMMLCQRFNGNDSVKLRACAALIAERMTDRANVEFFSKCARSKMPDSTLRIRVRQMQAAEDKSRKLMKRNGDLPEGL